MGETKSQNVCILLGSFKYVKGVGMRRGVYSYPLDMGHGRVFLLNPPRY